MRDDLDRQSLSSHHVQSLDVSWLPPPSKNIMLTKENITNTIGYSISLTQHLLVKIVAVYVAVGFVVSE